MPIPPHPSPHLHAELTPLPVILARHSAPAYPDYVLLSCAQVKLLAFLPVHVLHMMSD